MRTVIIENKHLDRRFMDFGWGNGYVILPKGHPMHGKDYMDIDADVNGGLTFSKLVDDQLIERIPELTTEDKGGWMVGFDTCHAFDTLRRWPKEEVQKEADRLMEQLTNNRAI